MRVLLLIAAFAIVFALLRHYPNESYNVQSKAHKDNVATIEGSDRILRVGIGSTLEQAHRELDPLRDPASHGFQDKEASEGDGGEKTYWRLIGTEYRWIMVWSNKEGRVVQLSASIRPERSKPFAEIGDLSKATTNLESAAKWNVQRPNNLSYRLIARGPHRHADNIYMIATALER
jgi:hypothetical protein